MKLSTPRCIPSIYTHLEKFHRKQADECLRVMKIFQDRGDKASVTFWQRIWKEKQQDADNTKYLIERVYR